MRSWYGLEDYESDLDTQSLKFLSFKLLLVGSIRLFLGRGTQFACSDLWVMGMDKFDQGSVKSEKGPETGSCITVVPNAWTGEKPASKADKEGSEIPCPFPFQLLYIPLPWWWRLCNIENMNFSAHCLNSSVAPHCSLAEASHYRCGTYF